MRHPPPPKHVVILCHPESDSFNGSVARRYCEVVRGLGQEALLRDLYRMNFNPVLASSEQPGSAEFALAHDVATELGLLQGAAAFVLIYPIWFGTPPAMLKGYVERVLGAGFTHRALRNRQFNPLLSGRRLLSFTSSGTTMQWLEDEGAWMSLRTVFDRYVANAFSLVEHDHIHFPSVIQGLSQWFVNKYLDDVSDAALQICAVLADGNRKPSAFDRSPRNER
jgi:NAD(P)H dehydrogenase (quinone)